MDQLWIFKNSAVTKVSIFAQSGRPMGNSLIEVETANESGATTTAALLGHMGSLRVPRRYPVLLRLSESEQLLRKFEELCRRSLYYDPVWIQLRPLWVGTENSDSSESHSVALLTPAQFLALESSGPSTVCQLGNYQILTTVEKTGGLLPGREYSVEMQDLNYGDATATGPLRSGETVLQATPSQPFDEIMRSAYSYYCALNPVHRQRLGQRYVIVCNDILEFEFPGLRARLALVARFDPRVPEGRIVLDESVQFAIGVPYGHSVAVSSGQGSPAWFRSRIFGNRHCLARVRHSTTLDMEKALTRLSDGVFDILGVAGGDHVVVEAATDVEGGGSDTVRRLKLRALPLREHQPISATGTWSGAPDFTQVMGLEDLPSVPLDVSAREMLGVTVGSAVYIRPAIRTVLTKEIGSVSLVLLGATFSAAALQNLVIASVAAAVYAALVLVVLVAKMR